MTSEVQIQKNRPNINNKQTSSQEQSASSSKSNNMDNQKKQVAPSLKHPSNKLNQDDMSDQLHHHQQYHLESSHPTHPAVISDRSLDPSDSSQQEPKQQQQIDVGDEDQGKHHVGPVMGIFFKVWSLVKGKLDKRKGNE